MPSFSDIQGERFSRLTVVRLSTSKLSGRTAWECLCDCGNTTLADGTKLRLGIKKSCGCLKAEMASAGNPKHGLRSTPEYGVWKDMRKRCANPNHISYKYYGARGITVSEEWNDFRRFYDDMGPRPTEDHSIDRIDVDGNYVAGNCRWATAKEQAANRRPHHG